MNPAKWENIKYLTNQALDLPVGERADILARETDNEIRLEAEQLLEAIESSKDFIDEPFLIEHGIADDWEADIFAGEKIGDYLLHERIGAGGMGAVYLATRLNSDFKQKVALKLIKRGMDSEAVLRRFSRERKILSTLKHPNIAQLLDGGISEKGLSFFVMEFVEGRTLNEFCFERNCPVEERLLIFRQICSAVEHAHKNLVVHRDLKPSNILVTKDGIPKLLDFGIAKLLSMEETEITQTQNKILTPEYAAPEQILGKTVTTAADIYSLGVVLYQLLSGHRPFDLKGKSFEDIVKNICEIMPERPSVFSAKCKVQSAKFENQTNQNDEQRTTNDEQKPNPKSKIQNPKSLKGDLDNIVLKALRKEPSERYATVQQFSEDITRYLNGLPVLARPQTLKYRFEKYIKRNKVGVVAAALVLLSLVSGISVAIWQAVVAQRERAKADHRFEQVRSIAKNVIFDYHDAIVKLPRSSEVRERMVADSVNFLNNLMAEGENSPELLEEIAAGYERVGYVQSNIFENNLNNVDKAIENYQKALAIRQTLSAEMPENTERLFALAQCYGNTANAMLNRGSDSENFGLYENALEIYEKLYASAPNDPKFREGLAQGFFDLGLVNFELRETEKARGFYKKALEVREKLYDENSQNPAYAQNLARNLKRLGQVFDKEEKYEDSIGLYRRAAELDEARLKLFPEDEQTKLDLSISYRAIGFNFMERKHLEQAWNYSEKTLGLLNDLSAIDPISYRENIAQIYRLLGNIKTEMEDYEKAAELFQKATAVGESLVADSIGDSKIKTDLALAYEKLAVAYEKISVQKNNVEFHLKGCREFQKGSDVWTKLGENRRLLGWENAAFNRVKKNLEKCN